MRTTNTAQPAAASSAQNELFASLCLRLSSHKQQLLPPLLVALKSRGYADVEGLSRRQNCYSVFPQHLHTYQASCPFLVICVDPLNVEWQIFSLRQAAYTWALLKAPVVQEQTGEAATSPDVRAPSPERCPGKDAERSRCCCLGFILRLPLLSKKEKDVVLHWRKKTNQCLNVCHKSQQTKQ